MALVAYTTIRDMKFTSKNFYALICNDRQYRSKKEKPDPMVCGVYSSKKEAQEAADGVKDCLCEHYIRRCKVTVEY